MSHYGLAIHIKMYLKAKEELRKLKYFTVQRYNLQKILEKETKIPQDNITLHLTSSLNTSQKYHLFKNPHNKNRPIIIIIIIIIIT
jgi:hypothetical protein